MIPIRLKLHNFMSYKDMPDYLDFRQLHIVCLSGANGHGKSSLLEAITYALWGKTRAPSEVDLIHIGKKNMWVDFEFELENQQYRVYRGREKTKSGSKAILEFYIWDTTKETYRTLTGNAIKETNKKIIQVLHIDYETFVNSAFILQGKADSFALMTGAKRKEVLAEMLNLGIYQELEKLSKEHHKEAKSLKESISPQLARLEEELSDVEENQIELDEKLEQLENLLLQLEDNKNNIEVLQKDLEKLHTIENHIKLINKQKEQLKEDINSIENNQGEYQKRQREAKILLGEEKRIKEEYNKYQKIKIELEKQIEKQDKFLQLNEIYQSLKNKLDELRHQLEKEISHWQAIINEFEKQLKKQENILEKSEEIKKGYDKYIKLQKEEKLIGMKREKDIKISNEIQQLEKIIKDAEHKLNLEIEKVRNDKAHIEQEFENLKSLFENEQEIIRNYKELEETNKRKEKLSQLEENRLKIERESNKIEKILLKAEQSIKSELKELNHRQETFKAQEKGKEQLLKEIELLQKKYNKLEPLEKKLQSILEEGQKLKEQIAQYKDRIKHIKEEYKKNEKKLNLLDTDSAICPLCNQPLSETHRQEIFLEFQEMQYQLNKELKNIEEKLKKDKPQKDKLLEEHKYTKKEIKKIIPITKELNGKESILEGLEKELKHTSGFEYRLKDLQKLLENKEYAKEDYTHWEKLQNKLKDITTQITDEKNIIEKILLKLFDAEKNKLELDLAKQKKERLKKELPSILEKLKELEHKETTHLKEEQKQLKEKQSQKEELAYERNQHNILQKKVKNLEKFRERYIELERAEIESEDLNEKLEDARTYLKEYQEKLDKKDYGDDAKEIQNKLMNCQEKLEELNYIQAEHQTLHQQKKKLANIETQYNALENAHKELKNIISYIKQNEIQLLTKQNQYNETEKQLKQLSEQIKQIPNLTKQLNEKNQIQKQLREEKTILNKQIGRLEGLLEQYKEKEKYRKQLIKDLKKVQSEMEIYDELIKCFGKNGIQALIIENAIPEIEEEANNLLSRMTDNRMHITLETQIEKSSKKGEYKETLKIAIADELGTREYELYSGGEAFRINFALRIAISKLLARRSGAKLQTLVIDEGFGTQDNEGKFRLVEIINAIRDEFEKILVITHLSELQEAFPARLEIIKTEEFGSQITIVG